MITRLTLPLLALLLASCAMTLPGKKAETLLAEGDLEQGIERLTLAAKEHPEDLEYRTTLARLVERHVAEQILQGQAALRAGNLDEAETRYRSALKRHPENFQGQAGLAAIETVRRNHTLLKDADAAYKKGEYEASRSLLRSILAREPNHAEAARLLVQVEQKNGKNPGVEFPQLAAAFRRPVTLQFKDTPIKHMFDAISRQSGLNFILDKDVKSEQRSNVFARDAALSDVLDMLLASNQLAKKTLNENTLLIYPATPLKQKDYQDMVVKSFFLTNANAKDVVNLLRSMAKIKDIHLDERLNMVVVREAPEVISLAEKLVAMADRPEAEVMLHVEILEVSGSKLRELGVQWPSQLTLLGKERIVTPVLDSNGFKIGEDVNYIDTPMTLQLLKDLGTGFEGSVGISPAPSVSLSKTTGDVNILANPRIRVKNKEKARIHIGDKVPIITSNVTSTGVTSESVSYLDVGLKLDVESIVRLDGDVEMRVGLEVSSIANTLRTSNGTVAYQLGSRNASTVLRLRDGETQVLAGLISDAERSSASKVPGIGDVPLLGRLFSNNRDEANKSEVVLMITPRVMRNIVRPGLSESEFYAGTERATSDRPMRIRPAQAQDSPEESPTSDAGSGDAAGVVPGMPNAMPGAAPAGGNAAPETDPSSRMSPPATFPPGLTFPSPAGSVPEGAVK